METDVLIIGAGVAGLAASRELSRAGLKNIILEARDRIGGRINTHYDLWPIELGAEFVHGKPPEVLQIAERAHLKLQNIPNLHWRLHNSVLTKSSEFWSKVEAAMDEMGHYSGSDQSFAQFLDHYKRKTHVEDWMHRPNSRGPWTTRCSSRARPQIRKDTTARSMARSPQASAPPVK
jgi:monoamine oxidase